MINQKSTRWIVFIGTYPPRECGIATFTQDLSRAVESTFSPYLAAKIVAIDSNKSLNLQYGPEVIYRLYQNNEDAYYKLAQYLNLNEQVSCINLQHEYGIFGGKNGAFVLTLLKYFKKPIITTLHTVLPHPSCEMQKVTQSILDYTDKVIVMTKHSEEQLLSNYYIPVGKVKVIPHGIHNVPFVIPDIGKRKLGFSGRTMLTTFGLLSRGKGIEYVLRALPDVVKQFPKVTYLIAGQTHPMVMREEGEKYRNSLVQLVHKLRLTNNVRFYNKFMELPELLEFLKITDIYIATSLNENQTVSGTFSYALGSGRATVSTKFAQAREYVSKNVGVLVDFKNPPAYRDALLNLLKNPEKRTKMHENAYIQTRGMLWKNVSISYIDEFLNLVLPSTSNNTENQESHLSSSASQFAFTFSKLLVGLTVLLTRSPLVSK